MHPRLAPVRDVGPWAPWLHHQPDVEAAWRRLWVPRPDSRASIWLMLLDARVPLPRLSEVTGAELPPSQTEILHLADLLSSHDDAAGLGFAFLRSRPGGPWLTSTDRAWVEALYDAAHQARVRAEVVHLATDAGIRPVLPTRGTWCGA